MCRTSVATTTLEFSEHYEALPFLRTKVPCGGEGGDRGVRTFTALPLRSAAATWEWGTGTGTGGCWRWGGRSVLVLGAITTYCEGPE